MKKSELRNKLVETVLENHTAVETGLTREETEFLVDGSIAGDFTDEELVSCIGQEALAVWNQIIGLLR